MAKTSDFLHNYIHYSRSSSGKVRLLSLGIGRSTRKLLPEAEGQVQQYPRASPHTEGQLIDCYPRSHGISVLWPNPLLNFYKNKSFCCLKIWWVLYVKQHLDHLKRLNITEMLQTGNSFLCDPETVQLFHNTINQKQNSGNS